MSSQPPVPALRAAAAALTLVGVALVSGCSALQTAVPVQPPPAVAVSTPMPVHAPGTPDDELGQTVSTTVPPMFTVKAAPTTIPSTITVAPIPSTTLAPSTSVAPKSTTVTTTAKPAPKPAPNRHRRRP